MSRTLRSGRRPASYEPEILPAQHEIFFFLSFFFSFAYRRRRLLLKLFGFRYKYKTIHFLRHRFLKKCWLLCLYLRWWSSMPLQTLPFSPLMMILGSFLPLTEHCRTLRVSVGFVPTLHRSGWSCYFLLYIENPYVLRLYALRGCLIFKMAFYQIFPIFQSWIFPLINFLLNKLFYTADSWKGIYLYLSK